MRKICILVVYVIQVFTVAIAGGSPIALDISGEWAFALDPYDIGIQEQWFNVDLTETIVLPDSLQNQGFGNDVGIDTPWSEQRPTYKRFLTDPRYAKYRTADNFKIPFWLQPEKHYAGVAWYQQSVSIPSEWVGKQLLLSLERCHWETTVWFDGKLIGSDHSLATPHTYTLTEDAIEGEHSIAIRIDNRYLIDIGAWAHSFTQYTQTNWNGIIGDITIKARDNLYVENLQVYPDVESNTATIQFDINTDVLGELDLTIQARELQGEFKLLQPVTFPVTVSNQHQVVKATLPMGNDVQLWDDFSPNLYNVHISGTMNGNTVKQNATFGMREVGTKETQLTLNDRPIFLRGTLDCCVFPHTGYPPTDVAAWKRIIRICKSYGLNHIRFHSWCPPEAAFVAADELGFYFQVECGVWGFPGRDEDLDSFIYEESKRILQSYGNHPSFLFLTHGNEPRGKGMYDFLGTLITSWAEVDSRHLYTSGANYPLIPENEFHNPGITKWFHLRMFHNNRDKNRAGESKPETMFDYRAQVQQANIPAISHEPGQWCAFPNMDEIEKYTGILKAKNFEIVDALLIEKGLRHQAKDFLLASGKLQALLYKEEIESFLRTPLFGGFQLLGLHDFPGQGTALVGVLDAFWEEKGYLQAKEHRAYCNETVPLLRLPKRVWSTDDIFTATVELAHYGPFDIDNPTLQWHLQLENGKTVANGTLSLDEQKTGTLQYYGDVHADLTVVDGPAKCTMTVQLANTEYENKWDIWVYPNSQSIDFGDVYVTSNLDDACLAVLEGGGNVLLNPSTETISSETYGSFDPIFWNKAWFPSQPVHSLGILCNPNHPALHSFPTEFHSNWHWWDLNMHSKPIDMDALPNDLFPIVQVIDDWNTCRKLGLIFEAGVGNGKILFSSIDLKTNLDSRPVAKQLLISLLRYMNSDLFHPKTVLSESDVQGLSTID